MYVCRDFAESLESKCVCIEFPISIWILNLQQKVVGMASMGWCDVAAVEQLLYTLLSHLVTGTMNDWQHDWYTSGVEKSCHEEFIENS